MADEIDLSNINFNSLESKKSILLNKYSNPDINFYNNNEIIKNINPLYYNPNSKKLITLSKKHWNIINEVIGKKKLYRNLLPENLKINNNRIINKSLVAEALNQFFVNIGPTLSSNIETTQVSFDSCLTSTNTRSMSNYKLTENELLDAVSLLKPNKSLGFDDISSNVIINSIKHITIPLLHIFNLFLQQGVFPNNLKIAKVIPILKLGDPSDVANYRPISILSCFSKVL
ncbi:uncharacterized protein LOC136076260 [Hydra vulgaris]|uniref:Uncharacterized protein LOC136076260 n=1 Tax=Hydra vulgaris TaxID=6087 RepID=A0ABM4BA73_HYDVU